MHTLSPPPNRHPVLLLSQPAQLAVAQAAMALQAAAVVAGGLRQRGDADALLHASQLFPHAPGGQVEEPHGA